MDIRKRAITAVAVAAIGLPLLGACSENPGEPASTSTATVSQSESAAPTGQALDLATNPVSVSLDRAIAVAGREFAGKPVSVRLQRLTGAPQYQVTLVSDTQEAEIDIDADTGEVRGNDVDPLEKDDFSDGAEPLTTNGLVHASVAMDAATKALPGAVSEWELKRRGNRIVYEISVDTTAPDDDVLVDARSGKVLTVD
ncbi:PepSY domain-containing protein [Gordonia hydrophobica]|uniref:PepSY domain-containing protein n=1 Tax=Gordonia hydrophobica TaxID=40516 RepID=A0ABZ2U4M7_9ACTN|nr:PepSY domain-containing protein [Gordonia hydrophobica]MBM7368305.1 putative membrane protein YkoI [Gordonia hydrophobica]